MALNYAQQYLTETEYLNLELTSELKHEYLAGEIYVMAGASRKHNILVNNISRYFGNHLANAPCVVFSSDMKLKIANNFFYPDVLVVCNESQGNDYYTEQPIIIIEVLSKSTKVIDKTTKLNLYKTIPSLQEYVIIEQDFVNVAIYRRNNLWLAEQFLLNELINFNSIDLILNVTDIYAKIAY